MPDGAHIDAMETLDHYAGYLRHTLLIQFRSKEAVEAEEALRSSSEPPNPYKK